MDLSIGGKLSDWSVRHAAQAVVVQQGIKLSSAVVLATPCTNVLQEVVHCRGLPHSEGLGAIQSSRVVDNDAVDGAESHR